MHKVLDYHLSDIFRPFHDVHTTRNATDRCLTNSEPVTAWAAAQSVQGP